MMSESGCQPLMAEAYSRYPGTQHKFPCSSGSNQKRLFLKILGLFLLLPNHKSFKILVDHLTYNRLQVASRTLNDRMPITLEGVLVVEDD